MLVLQTQQPSGLQKSRPHKPFMIFHKALCVDGSLLCIYLPDLYVISGNNLRLHDPPRKSDSSSGSGLQVLIWSSGNWGLPGHVLCVVSAKPATETPPEHSFGTGVTLSNRFKKIKSSHMITKANNTNPISCILFAIVWISKMLAPSPYPEIIMRLSRGGKLRNKNDRALM